MFTLRVFTDASYRDKAYVHHRGNFSLEEEAYEARSILCDVMFALEHASDDNGCLVDDCGNVVCEWNFV